MRSARPGTALKRNQQTPNLYGLTFPFRRMKKPVRAATREAMLRRYDRDDLAEGWFFRVREVSNGLYRVEGEDRYGRTVGRSGDDPDALLILCAADARAVGA